MDNPESLEVQPIKKKSSFTFFKGLIVAFGIVSIWGIGYLFGYAAPRTAPSYVLPERIRQITNLFAHKDAIAIDVLDTIWSRVHDKYVDPDSISDRKLYYGMLKGLVAGLEDPYSLYLDPDETKEFSRDLEGKFDGIGIEIAIKNKTLTVISALENSPAKQAGLLPNDAILEIDGESTAGMELETAVSKIRGESGSKVQLTVLHEDVSDPVKIDITRETIKTETVTSTVEDGIAIIEVHSFNDETVNKLDEAVSAISLKQPKGIIIDLRNNPGGLLDVSIDVAGVFLEKGTVVVKQKNSSEKEEEMKTTRQGKILTTPLVVLINAGSASASEIVAGALKDNNRATLIGEKTFGKGTVQEYEQLSDGSSLKLTVSEWLTPKGHSFNGEGITPDIIVPVTDEAFNAGKDEQLERAKQELQ